MIESGFRERTEGEWGSEEETAPSAVYPSVQSVKWALLWALREMEPWSWLKGPQSEAEHCTMVLVHWGEQ